MALMQGQRWNITALDREAMTIVLSPVMQSVIRCALAQYGADESNPQAQRDLARLLRGSMAHALVDLEADLAADSRDPSLRRVCGLGIRES